MNIRDNHDIEFNRQMNSKVRTTQPTERGKGSGPRSRHSTSSILKQARNRGTSASSMLQSYRKGSFQV